MHVIPIAFLNPRVEWNKNDNTLNLGWIRRSVDGETDKDEYSAVICIIPPVVLYNAYAVAMMITNTMNNNVVITLLNWYALMFLMLLAV